jgi:hypothetical protein
MSKLIGMASAGRGRRHGHDRAGAVIARLPKHGTLNRRARPI